MTNRTSGKDRLIQIQLADEHHTIDSGQYTGQIWKQELLGRLASGSVDQGGPLTLLYEGVAVDDALSSAGDDLQIQRKGAFKAVVKSTDAAAIAERSFRIKGSGSTDGLVLADHSKAVYVEDSMTLTVQPVPGLMKAGYITRLDAYGTTGEGECVVILDADWARAAFIDDEDLESEADAGIKSVDFDGIDIGNRMVLTERFNRRPSIEDVDITATNPTQAQMDAISASNKDFALAGTNMTTALCVHAGDRGGIRMTTAGADNDQCILQPRTDPPLQTRWNVGLDTRQGIRWVTSIRLPVITTISVKIGLALTNSHTLTVDADQTGVYFDTDNADVFWRVVRSIGGTDTESLTDETVVADTEYRIVIDIDTAGIARTFINDRLVNTSAALTDVNTLKPFISIQGRDSNAMAIDVRFQVEALGVAA